MRLLTTTASVALLGFTTVLGQGASSIPACAIKCFTSAVSKTPCSVFDYYCQCTTGAEQIAKSAFPCLCNDSDCSKADLARKLPHPIRYSRTRRKLTYCSEVDEASQAICSSALAASSQTYKPTPLPSNICKDSAGSGSSSAAAKATSTDTGASSSTAATDNAAAPTGMAVQGALLGAVGMAVLVL